VLRTRTHGALTAAEIRAANPPKDKSKIRLPAGPNLHLLVRRSPKGEVQKYWQFVYVAREKGFTRTMSLGSPEGRVPVSWREARDRADELLRDIRKGADPVGDKRDAKAAKLAEDRKAEANAVTFWEACEAHIEVHQDGWKNEVHAGQWEQTLRDHAAPLHKLPVGQVDTDDVLGVLRPIWATKAETASRLRGRIEAVLDSAKVRGWRSGENPARWKGHLALMLPKPSKVKRVKHHAAMPWRDVPGLMIELRATEGVAALALQFTILTAVRTGEAINARWNEIAGDVWSIPAERTKTGKEHRVPLSPQALVILDAVKPLRTEGDYAFPGPVDSWPITNMAMLMTLRRSVGKQSATVHGFRSSFRDWCADRGTPRELAEACLAHVVGGVEAAYFRSDILDRRREVLTAWADHCLPHAKASPKVVPLKPKRR
jgi:integrase